MANSMKKLIEKKFYKTADDVKDKLDVFFMVGRLTDEEYIELIALVDSVYAE